MLLNQHISFQHICAKMHIYVLISAYRCNIYVSKTNIYGTTYMCPKPTYMDTTYMNQHIYARKMHIYVLNACTYMCFVIAHICAYINIYGNGRSHICAFDEHIYVLSAEHIYVLHRAYMCFSITYICAFDEHIYVLSDEHIYVLIRAYMCIPMSTCMCPKSTYMLSTYMCSTEHICALRQHIYVGSHHIYVLITYVDFGHIYVLIGMHIYALFCTYMCSSHMLLLDTYMCSSECTYMLYFAHICAHHIC